MPDKLVLYDPAQENQIDGSALGYISCTCAAGSVSTDRNTFGKTILGWKKVRKATGDTSGGTTVTQVDDAIESLTKQDDLSTGYWRWHEVDKLIAEEGKGFLVAMVYKEVQHYGAQQLKDGVPQHELVSGQEAGFEGWHAQVWHDWLAPGESREVHGKTLTAPANQRAMIVFDPLADGRRSTVAKGPVAYPESLLSKIIEDSHLGGSGRLYGAVTLDGRYTVHEPDPIPDPNPTPTPKPRRKRTLKYGAKPIRKRVLTLAKTANLRSAPNIPANDPKRNVVGWRAAGAKFIAYQVKRNGKSVGGNRKWFGNRSGDLWVSDSRIA